MSVRRTLFSIRRLCPAGGRRVCDTRISLDCVIGAQVGVLRQHTAATTSRWFPCVKGTNMAQRLCLCKASKLQGCAAHQQRYGGTWQQARVPVPSTLHTGQIPFIEPALPFVGVNTQLHRYALQVPAYLEGDDGRGGRRGAAAAPRAHPGLVPDAQVVLQRRECRVEIKRSGRSDTTAATTEHTAAVQKSTTPLAQHRAALSSRPRCGSFLAAQTKQPEQA